ncbi:helix-turn-helix domain-containing protein [Actinacidiphila bryophytorum]|uniref:DNA-binding protein n=1 Tax=Actinacidiphila bryophytorum TaxID=1436133 RepID=A0A9W4E8P2_9ACTN|nr:helix-turn-helix transcriptional regulator [Actinacidiphila bryophytorum]MBM9439151.1 helix-turn-helix domain-containing protein [Actinacidiphila bryophytorum]MBN6544848.1 helix-turn-helix domain-containing protein [Actinacidiphila bryophytorum]CAG7621801.1 Putative DNA-binding protein [Actinacidiphila bryophytorum]
MSAQAQPVSPLPLFERRPDMGARAMSRVLGNYLRALRESRGYSPAAAGSHIRAHASKISRMETAHVSLKTRDVEELLQLYGVGDHERGQISQLVQRAASPDWWQPYGEVVPDWLQALIGLERDAHLVRTYETQFVPGLLQTVEYARAVVDSGHRLAPAAENAQRVELRLERQRRMAEPGAPVLWALIDEGVLHRPVGGAEVMRGQLLHLLDVLRQPGVRLQVASYAASAAATPGAAVTYLRFAQGFLPDVVYLEHMTSAVYLDRLDDVDRYRAALDELSALAATPAASRAILEEALRRYR